MSTPAPHTPDSTPRRVIVNRSFTLPSKAATTSRTNHTVEIGATEGVETLYVHPSSKIVKFTSTGTSRSASIPSVDSPGGKQSQGTLPWATPMEKTLAAGPLEIYRVPGSVSFLHSGSLLHAILPRSNCWCVDGVSKFAMRVLPDTYYRIELPGDSPEDLEKVEELKETLKKVLFFERTACPFARTFSVDLPEEPEVRKKKRRYDGPAKKWKLEKAYSWKPEDGRQPLPEDGELSSGSPSASDDEGSISAGEQSDPSELADQVQDLKITTPSRPSVRERARGFNMRAVTAPPQLALQSTPPSRLRASHTVDATADSRSASPSITADVPAIHEPPALRPFQSIPTDMPPSPPDSAAGYDLAEPPPPSVPSFADSEGAPPSNISITAHKEGHPATALSDQHEEVATPTVPEISHNRSDQWDHPQVIREEKATEPLETTTSSTNSVTGGVHDLHSSADEETNQEPSHESGYGSDCEAQVVQQEGSISVPEILAELDVQQPSQQYVEDLEDAEPVTWTADAQDPFAQIQARIQARRSIGGTTSYYLDAKSPTRQSSLSTTSSGSLTSSRSDASRRPRPTQQQQQAFATALVRKACATFLGPPAHLVTIMLQIAARFAKGAFPSSLIFQSPAGMPKRVPGSFDLDGSDVEDFGLDDLDGLEWEEDDFGVPLRSPVRLANFGEGGSVSSAVREHVKGRGTWSTSPEP